MAAYFVLLLAIVSRILPHSFHVVGLNFTAVGGSLLFFGSRRSRPQAVLAMLALMATDFYLTTSVYNYAFHPRAYLLTWAWYGLVCLVGHQFLGSQRSAVRVGGAVLATSTSFFVLSNLAVWIGSNMYAHSLAGLVQCYTAALPFYGNDLASTAITAGVLFGLPVLARNIADALADAPQDNFPTA